MDLFDLFASISLDTSEYESGLEGASEKTESFSDKLKSGLSTAAKTGAAAIATVTTAAAALGTAIVAQTGEVASYGDNIDKMSQKMGLTTDAYQEWDFIMQHCGTSIDSMQSSMKTLASAAETGSDAFEQLGLSQEAIANMSQEDLFSATITALQNVESDTERTYLAGQLLGRGATELGALLNTSAEDTEAMRQQVHELGAVMSEEAVSAAATYQDSLQNLQTVFTGTKNSLIGDFLPAVTEIMDGLTALFSGNSNEGLTLINEGIEDFIDNLSDTVPEMLEIGGQIVSSLASAILDNLPQIISAATNTIITLAQGLVSALPQIASAAIEIMSTLITAIGEALPDIMDTGISVLEELADGVIEGIPYMLEQLPDVIVNFIDFFTNNLPTILDMGFEILGELAFGIIDAIPTMVAKLPDIIDALVNFFTENFPTIIENGAELLGKLIVGIIGAIPEIAVQLPAIITAIVEALEAGWESIKNVGGYLLEGLWNGISDKVEWLKSKVTGVVDKIKSWFTGSSGFDTHSPSKWSKSVFNNVMAGAGEGISAGLSSVLDKAQSATEAIKSSLTFDGSGLMESVSNAAAALDGPFGTSTINAGASLAGNQQNTTADLINALNAKSEQPQYLEATINLGGAQVGKQIFKLYNKQSGVTGGSYSGRLA